VVSGSDDGTILCHDLKSGMYLRSINCHILPVHVAQLRNLQNTMPVSDVCCVKWLGITETRKIVTYTSDMRLSVYSMNGALEAFKSTIERLYALALSKDGRYLITGGTKGIIKLRSTYSLEVIWECGDVLQAPLPKWPGGSSTHHQHCHHPTLNKHSLPKYDNISCAGSPEHVKQISLVESYLATHRSNIRHNVMCGSYGAPFIMQEPDTSDMYANHGTFKNQPRQRSRHRSKEKNGQSSGQDSMPSVSALSSRSLSKTGKPTIQGHNTRSNLANRNTSHVTSRPVAIRSLLFTQDEMFMAVGLEDGRFAMFTPDKEYIRKRLQMKLADLGF
jgi:WD40 repeat protein